MDNNIKTIILDEKDELYSTLLSLHSRLTVLTSLDRDFVYDKEFIDGIIDISSDLKEDVFKCILFTE